MKFDLRYCNILTIDYLYFYILLFLKYFFHSRWKEELQEELEFNKKQTELLKKCLIRLKKALMKSDEPLKVQKEEFI